MQQAKKNEAFYIARSILLYGFKSLSVKENLVSLIMTCLFLLFLNGFDPNQFVTNIGTVELIEKW